MENLKLYTEIILVVWYIAIPMLDQYWYILYTRLKIKHMQLSMSIKAAWKVYNQIKCFISFCLVCNINILLLKNRCSMGSSCYMLFIIKIVLNYM